MTMSLRVYVGYEPVYNAVGFTSIIDKVTVFKRDMSHRI